MMTTSEKRVQFRKLHESGFFITPNPWDVGSAKRLAAMGFKALASTSGGAAMAIGKEDGERTLEEALAHLRSLVEATDLPITADFENGYADDPEDLKRKVALAMATGVAGLSIEDWSGREIYDINLAVERIAAAREAIDAIDPTAMLVGRYEQFRAPEMGLDAAIERIVAYAEAGADCLFVPGIYAPEQVAELVKAIAPKAFNVSVYQIDDSIREYARVGVRRCSTGTVLAGAAYSAADQLAGLLKAYDP